MNLFKNEYTMCKSFIKWHIYKKDANKKTNSLSTKV